MKCLNSANPNGNKGAKAAEKPKEKKTTTKTKK